MFLIGTAVFLLCSLAGQIHCGSSNETASVHVDPPCKLNQTECAFGCCPHPEAVCCAEEYCCEHGYVCLQPGICLGAVNDNGQVSLTSKKATCITSTVFQCPPGTTECAPGKCCPLPQAVCCSDEQHCCPHGYRCDLRRRAKCIPDATANESGRDFYSVAAFDKPLRKMSEKSPYKSCPGGSRLCPNYMSCCVQDNGGWGCCPNPSLPEIQYVTSDRTASCLITNPIAVNAKPSRILRGGECCDTIFGHMCCPDDYPVCTIFGCTK